MYTPQNIVQALDLNSILSPVRLVATTNQTGTYSNGSGDVNATFTYANGVLTIDSVTANLGDYIALTAQTLGFQNGIYQVVQLGTSGSSAILQRRADFQTLEQIALGHSAQIYAGTVNAGARVSVIEPLPVGMGLPVTSGANNINLKVK